MIKPNKQFQLDTHDIEMIEDSLLFMSRHVDNDEGKKEIQELLAKLHHQKNWYRPENYIGG
jgi:hypothetical protein